MVLASLLYGALFGCTADSRPVIRLINMDNVEKTGAIVYLDKNDIGLTQGNLRITSNNHEIPAQQIDTDGDGDWDQVLLLSDFEPKEVKPLEIAADKVDNQISAEPYTNISFSVKAQDRFAGSKITKIVRKRGATQRISDPFFQLEGPGIENDKVAFRTFFDPRNGKDIYGKTTDQMILDRAGIGSSWHQLSDWGMDILRVGQSLGAGGLGVIEDGKLYRLGDADEITYQELYSGALESSHRLEFKGWDAGSRKIDGSERLTLTKGKYYYRNDIGLSDTTLTLAVGIPSFKSDSVTFRKHNDLFSSISTYENQADGTDSKLGLAVLFSSDQYVDHGSTDTTGTVSDTHYVALKGQHETRIYFFACWELSDVYFSKRSNFEEYLQKEADKLSNAIQIIKK